MKCKRSSKVALLAALLMLIPTMSRAELLEDGTNDRRGFFIGAGLGAGLLNIRGGGSSDSKAAFLSNFRIGTGLSEEMQLMYQGGIQSTSIDGVTLQVYTTEAALNWFFDENFYVRPSLGLNIASASVNALGTRLTATSDIGLTLGVAGGYEFRVGEMFAISPEMSYKYSQIRGGGTSAHVNTLGAKILGTFYF